MQSGDGLQVWLIVGLIIIVWPIFFAALWSFVVLLISLFSGWRKLARRYRATERPTGTRSIPRVTGMVGMSRYKRMLSVTANEKGMFVSLPWMFSIGHPPLFIPWSEIHNARKTTVFYWEFIGFDIGNPKIGSMRLPKEVFDGSPVFIE